jgi:sec-independent protein translocase protein TatB
MFDIGWSELLVIGVVALIAIGPKELPGALRTLGMWMGKIRRMASDFQGQFQEAMREAEMADLKKQVDSLTSGFDPIESVRRDIEDAVADKPPSALATPAAESSASSDAPSVSSSAPSAAADAPSPTADTPSAYAPGADAAPADAHAATTQPASLEPATVDGAKPGDRPA